MSYWRIQYLKSVTAWRLTNTRRCTMISKESYKPFVWCVRLLSTLRCLPAYWDAEKECIQAFPDHGKGKYDLLISKIVIAFIVFLNCGVILHSFSLLFFRIDISPQEFIEVLFYVCIFSTALPVHIGNSLKFEGILTNHMNSLVKLNQDYGQKRILCYQPI